MNKNTEIVMVLDRSGSMASCRADTVGGVDVFIQEQKKDGLPTTFTLVLFDNVIEKPYNGVDIQEVPAFTDADFVPRGMTALLDAIGTAIAEVEERHRHLVPGDRPKIMIAIFTDGQENSSHEYTKDRIKSLVEQKTAEGWTFMFLSASLDAVAVGSSYGVDYNTVLSTEGMRESMKLYSSGVSMLKSARSVGEVDSIMLGTVSAQTANYLAHEGKDLDPQAMAGKLPKGFPLGKVDSLQGSSKP